MIRAIISTNGKSELLPKILLSVSNQTLKPDQIIIINVSPFNYESDLYEMSEKCGIDGKILKIYQFPKIKNISRVINRVIIKDEKVLPDDFIWVLHDDSLPQNNTLELLNEKLTNSNNTGIVAPKQVDFNDPTQVKEVGVKTTYKGIRINEIFNSEYDQGQYNYKDDVQGVGTAGMLFKFSVFKTVGGFDNALGPFFEGLDFSMRVRLKGFRVLIVPKAKIAHKQQTNINSQKSFFNKTRSQYYYSLLHCRFYFLQFINLFFKMLFNVFLHISNKELSKVFLEFTAFFKQNPFRIFYRRQKVRYKALINHKHIYPLMWSKNQAKELVIDEKLSKIKIRTRDNFEIKEHSEFVKKRRKTFWLLFAFITTLSAVLMLKIITLAPLISGGSLASYNKSIIDSWRSYFSSWQLVSVGYPGPKDPIALIMAVLNTVSFGHGGICLFIFYIMSPIIMFVGSWVFITSTGAKLKNRIYYSILFFLCPFFWISVYQGRIGAVITYVFFNYFAYSVVRLFGLHSSFRKFEFPFDIRQGSTMFASIAGLCLGIIGIGTPIILPAVFIFSIIFIKRIRSYIFLMWLPTFAFFLPTKINFSHNIKAIFAEPGIQFKNDIFPSFNSPLNEKIFFGIILFYILLIFITALINSLKNPKAIIGLLIAFIGILSMLATRYIVIKGIELTIFGVSVLVFFGLIYSVCQGFETHNKAFNNSENNIDENNNDSKNMHIILSIIIFALILCSGYSNYYAFNNLNIIQKQKNYSKIIDISNQSENSLKTLVLIPTKDYIKYSIVRSSKVQIDDFTAESFNIENKHFEKAVVDIINSKSSIFNTDGIGYIFLYKNNNTYNNESQYIDNANNINKIIENDDYILWSINNQARMYIKDNSLITPIKISGGLPIKTNIDASNNKNRKVILSESYSKRWIAYYNGKKLVPKKYKWEVAFNIPANAGELVIKYDDFWHFLIYIQLLILIFSIGIAIPIRQTTKMK